MTLGNEKKQDAIQSEIRTFVVNNFLLGQGGDSLNEDDSFLEKGIIDSTGILELVSFVEGTFGIKVLDEELLPDNLDSLKKLATFVGNKIVNA